MPDKDDWNDNNSYDMIIVLDRQPGSSPLCFTAAADGGLNVCIAPTSATTSVLLTVTETPVYFTVIYRRAKTNALYICWQGIA